jgi:hypothetical protein
MAGTPLGFSGAAAARERNPVLHALTSARDRDHDLGRNGR